MPRLERQHHLRPREVQLAIFPCGAAGLQHVAARGRAPVQHGVLPHVAARRRQWRGGGAWHSTALAAVLASDRREGAAHQRMR